MSKDRDSKPPAQLGGDLPLKQKQRQKRKRAGSVGDEGKVTSGLRPHGNISKTSGDSVTQKPTSSLVSITSGNLNQHSLKKRAAGDPVHPKSWSDPRGTDASTETSQHG